MEYHPSHIERTKMEIEDKRVAFTFYLDKDQIEWIREKANISKMSVSCFARQLIESSRQWENPGTAIDTIVESA